MDVLNVQPTQTWSALGGIHCRDWTSSPPSEMVTEEPMSTSLHSAALLSALQSLSDSSTNVLSDPPPRASSLAVHVGGGSSTEDSDEPSPLFSKPLPALPPAGHESAVSRPAPGRHRSAYRPQKSPYLLPEQSRSEPSLSDVASTEHSTSIWASSLNASQMRLQMCYRALLELVETERGYLRDLKLLADIYFPLLISSFPNVEDLRPRITRNVADLVKLHQRLELGVGKVEDMLKVDECGTTPSIEAVGSAADAFSTLILQEATAFEEYATFCAQHSEATAVIARCAQERIEYESYEQCCSNLIGPRPVGAAKLRLLDYAIKPVQRICRYPLLLSYLLKCLEDASIVSRATDEALATMRSVAEKVDRARVAAETDKRTLMVAQRLEMPSAAQPAFLSLLGQVQLVGALQFLFLTSSSATEVGAATLRIKYYGILLYPTHLVLIKVKKADCYEPRHWLPLRAMTLEKVKEGEGLLNNALRLTCGEHRYEFGCSTPAEQQLWYQGMLEARAGAISAWLARVADNPVETPFNETSVSSILISADETIMATTSESTSTPLPPAPVIPERSRLSQILGRTSAAMRDTIDLRLVDVFSDSCMAARYQSVSVGRTAPVRSRSTPLHRRKSFGFLESLDHGQGMDDGEQRSRPPGHDRRRSMTGLPMTDGAVSSPLDAIAPVESSNKLLRPSLAMTSRWRTRRSSSSRCTSPHSAEGTPVATASTASLPTLTALAAPVVALLNRNSSTSSSGSSAPPSPALATPVDVEPSPRWFSLNTMSRRSKSAVSLPPFASAQQEEQALAAADFLRGERVVERRSWRDSWKASTSVGKASAPSLLGIFKPTLSPTLPSPSPVPAALSTDTEPEPPSISFAARRRYATEPGTWISESSGLNAGQRASLPVHKSSTTSNRRKSVKVFRNLTMTRMSSSSLQ